MGYQEDLVSPISSYIKKTLQALTPGNGVGQLHKFLKDSIRRPQWNFKELYQLYLPNDNEWLVKNRGIRYKINPNVVAMGLAVRSLYLVTQYIPLSEAQAIAYHDGQYIDDNKVVAHKEEPLTLLLHWSDYWTAHVDEEDKNLGL